MRGDTAVIQQIYCWQNSTTTKSTATKTTNENPYKHYQLWNGILIHLLRIYFHFFFSIFFFQSEKRRTIPLTTFNVKVCTVTKWSIILFFLIVYATLRHKQVTRNATCDTFAYYIINLMNGLCQKTLCRLIQNSSLQ